MLRGGRRIVIGGLAVLLALGAGGHALAGWSVESEAPKRVILKYETEEDQTKLLMLACMRDINTFGVFSAGLIDQSAKYPLTLQMVNGHARYSVRGEMALDSATNAPTVSYQTDIDPKALQVIRAGL